MRILVYGAGVLGCELTHVLLQNKKNVVTLLARGEWKEMIDQKGLVIRHWAQRRTTTERVKTIDVLAPDDFYDLVFVVVQAGQLPDVLPALKANRSQYFVFVGNDPHAKQVLGNAGRAQAGTGRQSPDHLSGGPSGRWQNQYCTLHRRKPWPQVCAHQSGRRAG